MDSGVSILNFDMARNLFRQLRSVTGLQQLPGLVLIWPETCLDNLDLLLASSGCLVWPVWFLNDVDYAFS